jgi:hypothetical protein
MLKKIASGVVGFAFILAPSFASADLLSDLQAQVQALLAQIAALQAQQGSGTNVSALTITRDAGTPVNSNVIAGSSMVHVGKFDFATPGTAFTVQEVKVKIPADAAYSVSNVTLQYRNSAGVMQTVSQGLVLPFGAQTHGVATFTGLSMYIPQQDSGDLDVFVDIPTVVSGAKSGAAISVSLDADEGFKAIDSLGNADTNLGMSDVLSNAVVGYGTKYIKKTIPTLTRLSTGYTANTVASGVGLYRFTITADAAGAIDWQKVSFAVYTTGATFSNWTLYDVTGTSLPVNSAPTNVSGTVLTICSGATCGDIGGVRQIGAGTTATYELRAGSVVGWSIGDAVTIALADDRSPVQNQSGATVPGNFVWSDRSASGHTLTTADWTNGYLVRDMDNDTRSCQFGSSTTCTPGGLGTVTPPSPSSGITVTSPNGGEQWEIGTLNTITWSPYGYNPDVNPAKDVNVFLERLDGSTVAQIMDTGKASLHTYFNIVNYNTWATPGQYRVYIGNKVTGATDRSDAPFTLLPRPIDLKVNGSDGPLGLANNQKVTVSWTGSGVKYCALYNVQRVIGGAEGNIANLPPTGTLELYFSPPPGASNNVWISCERPDGTTRGDSVQVNMAGETGAPASIKVISPNGSESINPALSSWPISVNISGLKSLSLALYKNDQWYAWLFKDVSTDNYPTSNYVWVHSHSAPESITGITSSSDNGGAVWKMYATGLKRDGTGYVDDKSDAPFSFTGSTVNPPAPPTPPTTPASEWCTVDDVLLNTNSSWRYYSMKVAPAGKKCADYSQMRTCKNGVLGGNATYAHASCKDSFGTGSCSLDGVTVASGASRKFYSDNVVAYGKTCEAVAGTRRCDGDSLTGSTAYRFATCKVATPKSCTLGGVTVAHEKSRRFYMTATAPNCNATSQIRTCDNGVLNGSNSFAMATCQSTADTRGDRGAMVAPESQVAAVYRVLDDIKADLESAFTLLFDL